MAYFAISPCFGCGRVFTYNPDKVPSIPHPETGDKWPVCQACVDRANPERKKNGLPLIVPLPGAYDAQPEPSDTDYEGGRDEY